MTLTRSLARTLGIVVAALGLALAAPAVANAADPGCRAASDVYKGDPVAFQLSASCDGDGLVVDSISTNPGSGSVTIAADKLSVTYTGVNDPSIDKVTFEATVKDAQNNTYQWPVTVTYDLPFKLQAVADIVTTNANTPVSGDVTGNDVGANGAKVELVSGPSHGKLDLDAKGKYTYTPDKDYSGSDTFTYRLTLGKFTSEAPANITVKPAGSGGGSPSPTTPAATTTSAKAPLAKTGFGLLPVALTGAGVLAAGAGVLFAARRRRDA